MSLKKNKSNGKMSSPMISEKTESKLSLRRILFITGTRADFGKIKPLVSTTESLSGIESHIVVTGMHLIPRFGDTWREVERAVSSRVHLLPNSADDHAQDLVFARSVEIIGGLIKSLEFDLVLVHGDRVEALGGAIAGLLNHVPVAHIEGGELSGTVDEMLRHSISKLATYHLVANEEAKVRLLQMGEMKESIQVIGSPDIDVMASTKLPAMIDVRNRYEIPEGEFGIILFHPNVTNRSETHENLSHLIHYLRKTERNFVVIFPNNDPGHNEIIDGYSTIQKPNIRVLPSMRFEFFLTLLRNTSLLVGNSSAGIRETPFYGTPSLNLGTRQDKRSLNVEIGQLASFGVKELTESINELWGVRYHPRSTFGDGSSADKFRELLLSDYFWSRGVQKTFNDLT